MTSFLDERGSWISPLSLNIIGELVKGPLNVLQLKKRASPSTAYVTMLRQVNKLEVAGIVVSTYEGGKRVVSLRPYYVTDVAIELFNRLRLREILHAAPKEIVNAVLNFVEGLDRFDVIEAYFFGSFVTKTARRGSDVDVLLIIPDGSDTVDEIRSFVQAVSETVAGEMHPVFLYASEFERLKKERDPLVEGAVSRGIKIRCFAKQLKSRNR
jgi:predicted nucleotidyltransferase